MSIADDIKAVFEEVGTAFTIVGTTSGEYCVYDIPSRTANPSMQGFVLEADLSYDTATVDGSVIEFTDGRRYLVTHNTPDIFEDSPVLNNSLLYKCNVVSGELFRASGEVRDIQTYHITTIWEYISGGINALIVEESSGNNLVQSEIGQLSKKTYECYLPSFVNSQVLDRFQPYSGEFYKVEQIRNRKLTGIDILVITEDTR